jgi:glycosyltransferase involved in cell wall biosynthesis
MPGPRHLLKPRPDPALLSMVVPAFNEEAMIPLLRQRWTEFVQRLPCPTEIILINDGSTDNTIGLLLEWAAADPRVKVLGLARNFGQQAAITAGLDAAGGDAVVIIDADLQDPLDVIVQMLDHYRQGYDVVYGQRLARQGESVAKRLTAWAFYRLMRLFLHPDLPADTGDFRLLSRPFLDALRTMRETHRFLRGMVAWAGFAQTPVPYHRAPRAAGDTKYPMLKMLRFAGSAAVSFSPAPLRLSLACGLVVALLGLGEGAYAVARALIIRDTTPGWTSLIAITCLIGGAILVSIGILGEYVGRIFEESKGRPLYLISTTANIEAKP